MGDVAADFISGKLDHTLIDCSLVDGEKVIFHSAVGRLFVSDGKLRLKTSVLCDANASVLFHGFIPTGECIFKAQMVDGSQLQVKPWQAHLGKLYGRTKYADWYFECERVDTSYPLTAVPSSGSYGYITPISEPIFDQNTVTDIVGFNDGKGGSRDWLQFWVAEKEFRVKKADSDHSLIKVSAPACSRSEMELASNALLDALSIRLGRKLRLKALTTVSESVRTDTLFPHGGWGSDGTGMYAPVPFHIESDIPFLRSTTEYFLMDRPRDFIPHVAKFWDSQNQSFNSTCLHLTTAIEGLIDLILDSNLVPNQGVKETLTKQRTLFKKVKADTISAIEKIATEETSAMCTRLRDVIQNVRTKNPPLELLEAAAIVGANIRPDHADGWEKLRNVVAHGGIAGPHDSEQLTHFFGSITVLNALVLGMVGWSGPIKNFDPPIVSMSGASK